MTLARSLPAALFCLAPGAALAQTSYVAPDGRNRFPAVTIFCPSGTGVAPCNFGSGGGSGGGGAVSINQGGSPVSASNRLPVQDTSLDGLISGGALSIGGTVSLSGGSAVAISNLPAVQPVSGAVSQSGSWSVGLANGSTVALSAGNASIGQVSVASLPPLPAGTNAIGSVTVANLPATQPVSGAVSQAGTWSVGLSAGSNAIGSVSVSNLPATQPVSAASLPLPAGAATAAGQSAALGPVAPGTPASNSTLVGCVANTTLPSFTAGQQGAVPCDTSGRPYVVTVPSANNVPTYLQAVASGGATIFRAINAASSTMATSVKGSSGLVYAYEACNTGTSGAYLRLFALGAAPTVGTSTPAVSKLLAPGTCQETGVAVGMAFSGGIAFDVTSGSLADNDTTAVASANQISVEIYYK